jgi:transcriptional regulator with XRE-family HTH domain
VFSAKEEEYPRCAKICVIISPSQQSKLEELQMKPLQLSPETAIKLAKKLNVPIEQLMHMPQHILIQKLMELENEKEEN